MRIRSICLRFSMPCLKSKKSDHQHGTEESPGKRSSASKSGRRNKGRNDVTKEADHGHRHGVDSSHDSGTATIHSSTAISNDVGTVAMVVAASHASEMGGSTCGGSSHGGGGDGGG